jgi:hypothetical protein
VNPAWDPLKSKRLKKTRGLSFEELLEERYITTKKHPKRENQLMMLYERKGYIWVIPYVNHGDAVFLKTLYQSRYWTKKYQKGEL